MTICWADAESPEHIFHWAGRVVRAGRGFSIDYHSAVNVDGSMTRFAVETEGIVPDPDLLFYSIQWQDCRVPPSPLAEPRCRRSVSERPAPTDGRRRARDSPGEDVACRRGRTRGRNTPTPICQTIATSLNHVAAPRSLTATSRDSDYTILYNDIFQRQSQHDRPQVNFGLLSIEQLSWLFVPLIAEACFVVHPGALLAVLATNENTSFVETVCAMRRAGLPRARPAFDQHLYITADVQNTILDEILLWPSFQILCETARNAVLRARAQAVVVAPPPEPACPDVNAPPDPHHDVSIPGCVILPTSASYPYVSVPYVNVSEILEPAFPGGDFTHVPNLHLFRRQDSQVATEADGVRTCLICHELFERFERIEHLGCPCETLFHSDCVERMTDTIRFVRCPVCRWEPSRPVVRRQRRSSSAGPIPPNNATSCARRRSASSTGHSVSFADDLAPAQSQVLGTAQVLDNDNRNLILNLGTVNPVTETPMLVRRQRHSSSAGPPNTSSPSYPARRSVSGPSTADPAPSSCSAPQCTCRAPGLHVQGRHASSCPRSRCFREFARRNSEAPPQAEQAPNATPSQLVQDLPDLRMLLALPMRMQNKLPKAVVGQVAAEIGALLAQPRSEEASLRLLCFPKLVLSKTHGNGTSQIRQRIRLWRSGNFAELLVQANLNVYQTNVEVFAQSQNFPIDDDDGFAMMFDTDAASVPEAVAKRAADQIHNGLFSKAMGTLAQAQVAPFDAASLDELRRKHPDGSSDAEDLRQAVLADHEACTFEASPELVRKALHTFPRGSASGPSGLPIEVLKQLCGTPGIGQLFLQQLTHFTTAMIRGECPENARVYFFGAKLIALVKKDDTLRPVAMGEVIRRLISKVALAASIEKAMAVLTKGCQWAIGVPDGLMLVVHTARRLAQVWHTQDSRKGFCKLDQSNAFNEYRRSMMIRAVDEHVPMLSSLVRSAYGRSSLLFFGNETINSEKGGQQGDVLANLLYCLTQHNQWRSTYQRLLAEEVAGRVDFSALFADDDTFGGEEVVVARVVEVFAEELARADLKINWSKCEVISDHPWNMPIFSEMHQTSSLSDWSLLSSPCGDQDACARFTGEKLQKAAKKFGLVASLGEAWPHEALALSSSCLGWAQANFFARAGGWCPAFPVFDTQLRTAVESFTHQMSDSTWTFASLPKVMGGLGIRRTSDHASIAFLAAYASASPSAEKLLEQLDLDPHLDNDELFVDQVTNVSVTPSVLRDFDDTLAAGRKVTAKQLSKIRNNEILEVLFTSSLPEEVARMRLLSAPGCGDWLSDPSGSCTRFWLEKDNFLVYLKARLGVRILRIDSSDCPFGCRFTNSNTDTGTNAHILSCMTGGNRSIAHSWLKAKVHTLCGSAGYGASFEQKPFLPPFGNLMIDVEAKLPSGRVDLIDTALTNPIGAGNLAFSLAYSRQRNDSSTPSPAAAATRYEAVKVAKYGATTAALGPDFKLVPFVVDVFGGLSASASRYISQLATEIALREGGNKSVVGAVLRREIASAVARGVSTLLLHALCREEGYAPTQSHHFDHLDCASISSSDEDIACDED